MAAVVSYATSHYYNRMFTDRPYWWLLVIILTFEYYLLHQVRAAGADPVLELEQKRDSTTGEPLPVGMH
jgi:hypothetical protein